MLISCPNCKTTFAIPAKAVGATGKKVKCSKCAHIWMQPPLQIDKAQLDNLLKVEFKPSNTLPAKIKTKTRYTYAASLIILLVLSLLMQIFKAPENFPVIAQKLALYDYDGLRFHNFTMQSELVDNKLDFYLKGSIINTSDKKIKIPEMNISILSAGGRVMAKNQFKVPQDHLEPFEKIDVSPEITRVSGNANKIELTFENWAESTFK